MVRDMTRRLVVTAISLMTVLSMTFGIGSVSSSAVSAHKTPVQRVHHPCDLNKNSKVARGTGSAEDLCLVVWRHAAYTLSNKHGTYQETPAGPAVVVDLLDQAYAEGRSAKYFRGGLLNEISMYAKRDR